MSLNVMLAFVILENSYKPVGLADFRDAVADNRAPAPAVDAVPAELLAPPAVEAALVDAAPAASAVEAPAPRPAIVVANDWAAYKQEMAVDRDVVVSNLFLSERNGERAMNAAVNRLLASGKDVVFSCLMPATGGGTFYLIRLVPAAQQVPRVTSASARESKEYEIEYITERAEKEVWGSN